MKNNSKYVYRLMNTGEEDHVYGLIMSVFQEYVAPTYSQTGIETFLGMLTLEFLEETSSEKFMVVAEHESQVVGILKMISISHIALLFVDSRFQGQGIGKGLIRFGIGKCLSMNPGIKAVTVSSSQNSISFYENVGFVKIGDEKDENGMRFIPMRREIDK
jgi:predicted GNAT family N-acyltransferase